jgi:hypothetical protein
VRETIKFIPKNFGKLVLFRIRGSHKGGYEDFYLPEYNVVEAVEIQPTSGRNISPLSSRPKNEPNKKLA